MNSNLTTAFDILCEVVPDYQYVAEGITNFLERYPDGCKCVSRCNQTISDKSTGSDEERHGMIFGCDNSLIFLKFNKNTNSVCETTHNVNELDQLTIDGKNMVIKTPNRAYVYEFDNKTNKILEHVTGLFEMRNSCIKVKNVFFKPAKIKVVMLTIGSRGDIQPFISLALGLNARGYDTKIVTHSCFEEFVTKQGI